MKKKTDIKLRQNSIPNKIPLAWFAIPWLQKSWGSKFTCGEWFSDFFCLWRLSALPVLFPSLGQLQPRVWFSCQNDQIFPAPLLHQKVSAVFFKEMRKDQEQHKIPPAATALSSFSCVVIFSWPSRVRCCWCPLFC